MYTSEPSEHAESLINLPHSRNSGTTLHVSGSERSYLTDPLLYPQSSDTTACINLLSGQAASNDETEPIQWNSHTSLLGDPPSLREKRNYWERTLGRRLKRLRYLMRSLELVFGAFTLWPLWNNFHLQWNSWLGHLQHYKISYCVRFAWLEAGSDCVSRAWHLHLHLVCVACYCCNLQLLSTPPTHVLNFSLDSYIDHHFLTVSFFYDTSRPGHCQFDHALCLAE